MRFQFTRARAATLTAVGGVAVIGLSFATPALAYEANAGVVNTSSGTVVVSCETPNPAGAETSPTASSGGVTVPTVSTPAIPVPPVTIGQVQVGPESVGPYTVGGFTIPSVTVGGETVGNGSSPDTVAGVGGTACAATNVTNPLQTNILSGYITLQIQVEELNPNTGQLQFVEYVGNERPLDSTPVTLSGPAVGSVPPPSVGADFAVGEDSLTPSGVPAAGQVDPTTGDISAGIAQVYLGVSLAVNGQSQPTGVGCETGDYSCSTSSAFPVF